MAESHRSVCGSLVLTLLLQIMWKDKIMTFYIQKVIFMCKNTFLGQVLLGRIWANEGKSKYD